MPVIVLDPGHGGSVTVGGSSPNNGTGPAGLLEKVVTLTLGRLWRDELITRGHDVTLARSTDTNLGLADRAAVAKDKKADAFVSIHLNAWKTPDVQGTETLLNEDHSAESRALADAVQKAALNAEA